MKSINDATWKDAAIIEARSLSDRLKAASDQGFGDTETKERILRSFIAQADRLVEAIEKIEEVKANG